MSSSFRTSSSPVTPGLTPPSKKAKSSKSKSKAKQAKSKPKHAKSKPHHPKAKSRSKTKKQLAVHVARWFDRNKPQAVESVSMSSDSSMAAVGRSDGSIELWNLQGSYIERAMAGVGERTLKSLILLEGGSGANIRHYVLSAGMHGWLYLWDIESLSIIARLNTSAVWNLSVQRQQAKSDSSRHSWLCAGACDDGTLRLWKIEAPLPATQRASSQRISGSNEPARIILWQTLAVSGSGVSTPRCLSVCWSSSGRRVMAGTSDGVVGCFELVDDASQGDSLLTVPRQLMRIRTVRRDAAAAASSSTSAPASAKKKRSAGSRFRCCLWSLASLTEDLVCVATAFGTVDIYNVLNGTLVHSCPVARGDDSTATDVLSIALSRETGVLVAACMDGRVVQCSLSSSGISATLKKSSSAGAASSATRGRKTAPPPQLICTGYHTRHEGSDALTVTASGTHCLSGAIDGSLVVCATRDFFRHWFLNPFACAFQHCSDRHNWRLKLSKVMEAEEDQGGREGPAWLRGLVPPEAVVDLDEAASAMRGQLLASCQGTSMHLWRAVDGVRVMTVQVTTRDDEGRTPLLCFAMADDARWLACATCDETWLFELVVVAQADGTARSRSRRPLAKCRWYTAEFGCSVVHFDSQCRRLFMCPLRGEGEGRGKSTGGVRLACVELEPSTEKSDTVEIEEEEVKAAAESGDEETGRQEKEFAMREVVVSDSELRAEGIIWHDECVTSLSLSDDGSMCALNIGSLKRVLVLDASSGRLLFVCPKGTEQSGVACARFQQWQTSGKKTRSELWLVYSNNSIKIWSLTPLSSSAGVKSVLHPWCKNNAAAWDSHSRGSHYALTMVSFKRDMPYRPVLGRTDYLMPVSLKDDVVAYRSSGSAVAGKMRKRKLSEMKTSDGGGASGARGNLKVIEKFDTCLLMSFLTLPKQKIESEDGVESGEEKEESILFVVHRPRALLFESVTRTIYRKRYAI